MKCFLLLLVVPVTIVVVLLLQLGVASPSSFSSSASSSPLPSSSCHWDDECPLDAYCNFFEGECKMRATEYQRCLRDAMCQPNLRCHLSRCDVPKNAGSPCFSHHQCKGQCEDGVCTDLRNDGSYCDSSSQCKSGACKHRYCDTVVVRLQGGSSAL